MNIMRTAEISRKTKETDINVFVDLDNGGVCEIETGIGFFDHMLTALSMHSGISLKVSCKGDLNVDCHHSVEDTGIVIGQALAKALGDKSGIERYGTAFIPMDEALAMCSMDISGRPYLVFDAAFTEERIGEYDTCMTEEFFRALSFNAGITLHLKEVYGKNAHHITEALFKSFAHALKNAVCISGSELLSTKGIL